MMRSLQHYRNFNRYNEIKTVCSQCCENGLPLSLTCVGFDGLGFVTTPPVALDAKDAIVLPTNVDENASSNALDPGHHHITQAMRMVLMKDAESHRRFVYKLSHKHTQGLGPHTETQHWRREGTSASNEKQRSCKVQLLSQSDCQSDTISAANVHEGFKAPVIM